MSDVDAAVTTLLEEKPHLEDDLREILTVDAAHETWSFNDVPVDSGAFGELVSREVVVKQDGGYTLADAETVRRALKGKTATSKAKDSDSPSVALSLPKISLRWAGALAAVVAIAALLRGYTAPSVFRGEHIFFLGNDPYFYRHWIRQLALAEAGPLAVPTRIQNGEPLLIAMVWSVTTVLGGNTETPYMMLALYPLVCGLLTIPLIYELTRRITEERRIALAAATLLAVTPVHAFRTTLGFSDHHAFDYLWLAVTLAAGVALIKQQRSDKADLVSRAALFWIVILGIGVAGQTLAWNAGPLLLIPLGLFSLAVVITARAHETTPLPILAPITIGLGLASIVVWVAHLTLGWQPLQVILSTTLLFVGVGVVLIIGVAANRYELSPQVTAGAVIAGGAAALGVALVTLPEYAAEFSSQLTRLTDAGATEGIVETNSIFSPEYGTIFGPMLFFGLALFFALPYLPWSMYRGYREYSPVLLLIGLYASVFCVLATLQVRFAGELSIVLAPFLGLAFVHLSSAVGAISRPRIFNPTQSQSSRSSATSGEELALPDREQLLALGVVFLLVGGFGVIQGPVQINKLVYDDAAYQTATWIESHSSQSLSNKPQYVFSAWGQNRMYNAFVTGDSQSYRFAQQRFSPFVSSNQPDAWYGNLSSRVGYIVTTDADTGDSRYAQTTHALLHESFGSATAERSGAGHYRAVYRSPSGSHTVLRPVAGAVITGTGDPGTMKSVTTNVAIPNAEFTYQRRARVNDEGTYEVRVSYPGTYTIGQKEVRITERDIRSGSVINTSTS